MVKGVLLDLSGVLYVGNKLLPNALQSLELLHKQNIPLRFITNTTRSTRYDLLKKLSIKGLKIPKEQLFTAPIAARQYVKDHKLSPYLLIHPNLRPEFSEFKNQDFDAVLVGDAGSSFTYETLNAAFRILLDGATLLAMGDNRYFKEEDGFSLDAGPFVHALESASGVKATILGKPANEFFLAAIKDFHCSPNQVVMVGDDVDADVNGALSAGLQSILVQTGKYRASDDQCIQNASAQIATDIGAAVDIIINEY